MINISKLLKDAPKDMKLYSPLFGEVKFKYINDSQFGIVVEDSVECSRSFDKYGRYFTIYNNAECLLFPSKECRTWENFELPVKSKFKVGGWVVTDYGKVSQVVSVDKDGDGYTLDDGTYFSGSWCDMYHFWTIKDTKDGDILVSGVDNPFIYNGNIEFSFAGAYVGVSRDGRIRLDMFPSKAWTSIKDVKPASKKQRDLLFQKIKEIGYEWNTEKKELRKIQVKPKFKVGDWITNGTFTHCIISIVNGFYYFYGGGYLDFGKIDGYYHLWTIEDAKDGDILACSDWLFILKQFNVKWNKYKTYCHYDLTLNRFKDDTDSYRVCGSDEFHPATKDQRDLLFAKMKEAGYEWNERKELHKIIEPKFKVGDNIKTGNQIETIAEVGYATRSYYCESGRTIYFANQDLWHLVPKPHYDINNFHAGMPVLVRDSDNDEWTYTYFSHITDSGDFNTGGWTWRQCIPFEGNKHLLGTTDMCDEQYINWRKL